jgi:diguanylate cyclase (GGDEF)-like protein/PAS domain S-box-containing protein
MLKPTYARFRSRLILSFSLLIALLAALMFWKISSEIQSDRDAAFAQTESFARAMSAHMESVTRVIDLSLLRSSEALGALDREALKNSARARRLLALSASSLDASFWVHFIDAQGIGVAASNGLPIAGVSYADRSYFKVHLGGGATGLYVGGPEIGRVSKRRLFFLSRGVFGPKGEFLGVVVASVDATAIADVFANAMFQPTLSITLLHGGGKIIARAPLFERSFASDLTKSDLYRRWKAAPSGSYEGRSAVDGQQRVFSYRTVGKADMAVAVGIAVDSWTRAIPKDIAVALGALAVIGLALVFSGRFALRSFLRFERGQAELERLNDQLRAARDANARGEKRARIIADSLPALVAYIGPDKRYAFHNSFYNTLLGHRESLLGRAIWEVMGEELYASVAAEIEAVLSGTRVSFERSLVIGSSERWFKFEYTPDIDEAGVVIGFYTMGIDVTEMKEVQDRLRASARIDGLTGLPNRARLYERLTEALARSKRGVSKTACLFLDIDHFKAINDTLGHGAGDEALREFGRRLQSAVRETDLVGRLAGDEFVIVLEGVDQPAAAQIVASKIIDAMRASFFIAGEERSVSTSVGVAVSEGRGDDADSLLKRADEALYRAKRAGRGGFAIGSEG